MRNEIEVGSVQLIMRMPIVFLFAVLITAACSSSGGTGPSAQSSDLANLSRNTVQSESIVPQEIHFDWSAGECFGVACDGSIDISIDGSVSFTQTEVRGHPGVTRVRFVQGDLTDGGVSALRSIITEVSSEPPNANYPMFTNDGPPLARLWIGQRSETATTSFQSMDLSLPASLQHASDELLAMGTAIANCEDDELVALSHHGCVTKANTILLEQGRSAFTRQNLKRIRGLMCPGHGGTTIPEAGHGVSSSMGISAHWTNKGELAASCPGGPTPQL